MQIKEEIKIWIHSYSIKDDYENPRIVDLLSRTLKEIERLESKELSWIFSQPIPTSGTVIY